MHHDLCEFRIGTVVISPAVGLPNRVGHVVGFATEMVEDRQRACFTYKPTIRIVVQWAKEFYFPESGIEYDVKPEKIEDLTILS